jgi:dihydrolipoamide dehydrogenase
VTPLGTSSTPPVPQQGDASSESLSAVEVPPLALQGEPEIDADAIIEAAEEMLRENAPHDYEVLVIGAGPGGSVCAIRAAQLGLRVGLIEERELGGVCLNRGCIPTKTLLESAEVMRLLKIARSYGIHASPDIRPDIPAMHARKDEVVASLRENLRRQLEEAGVQVLEGQARFVGEHVVELSSPHGTSRRLTAVHVVVAAGSVPAVPDLPGFDSPLVLTSDGVLELREAPQVLVTVGAGAVGVEFAYLFHELGSRSIVVEAAPQALPGEDAAISEEMEKRLRGYGIDIRLSTQVQSVEERDGRLHVRLSGEKGEVVVADKLLVATGRRANTGSLGLETAGIEHEKGVIKVDEHCETNVAGVYAIGDCVRGAGWAHQASGEGALVAELLAGREPSVDLRHLPSCYYTHPEIASVGQTEKQARESGLKVRVGTFRFRSSGRAQSAGEPDGFVRLVVEEESEKLLGCQIIGPRATELINEAVVALKHGHTVEQVVGAVHAHPTFAEALPEAALQTRRDARRDETTES